MRYVSTRGGMAPASFSETILEGLAPDGGLTVPETYPTIDVAELARWRNLSYPELAFEIIRLFCDDIPLDDLRQLVQRSYTAQVFGRDEITPLVTLEPNLHLLQLSNGPTLAFKDLALQLLGHLFAYMLDRTDRTLTILGATSGDTGSAAEYAMLGKDRVRVVMLSPLGKMSPFQTAQMYSLQDPAIHNVAIEGVFDDCQDIVKTISADAEFKAAASLGAVNSINWARIVAQVVYYFKGYFAATRSNDEQVSFAVPSGNFGNICAGHIARMMGLPIKQLVLATNENDVLDEFFKSGRYRVRRTTETQATSSPSMDISKASNLERFIFDLVDREPSVVRTLWAELDESGKFDLLGTPHWQRMSDFGFVSGSSSHADRLATIRSSFQSFDRIIDPHTADGLTVALKHRQADVPMIVLETAQPVKFEATITEALGQPAPRPAGFDNLESLPQRFTILPADTERVKDYILEQVMPVAA